MSSPKKTKTTKKAFSSVSVVDIEQVNLGFDEIECIWIQCKESSVTTLYLSNTIYQTLREMCPNTELFLVRIFPYSD